MEINEYFNSITYWQFGGLLYLLVIGYVLFNLMRRQDFRHSHEKLFWILLLLITPVLGMMLYFIKSNPRRRRRGFNPDFSKN